MSNPARLFRFSMPRWLVLVALLELTGLAVATTYPPADPVAPVAHQVASITDQRALRVGVESMPGDVRSNAGDGVEYDLADRLAARLGRDVHLVKVDPAQRGPALEKGTIDVFVGRFAARPVPAGVDIVASGHRSGLSVAMRADSPPLSLAGAHADRALSATVREVLADARQSGAWQASASTVAFKAAR